MDIKLNGDEIRARAQAAHSLADPCRLCPRECGAARLHGERGYCGAGSIPRVARILPHFGEEPPICGPGGAGTIFFTHCNLRCAYCQNYQISQHGLGADIQVPELTAAIVELAASGCSTIEPVSPTHFLPWFLEALASARARGIELPVVYNTNGYESQRALELLDGVVDVWLPDLKYDSAEAGKRYSDADDYPRIARAAVKTMLKQVGPLECGEDGAATRGLIVRRLILPADIAGTREFMEWTAENLGRDTVISLMAQYTPLFRAGDFPEINRRITEQEYDALIEYAWGLGLENVFVQDFASQDVGTPDFDRADPFLWD